MTYTTSHTPLLYRSGLYSHIHSHINVHTMSCITLVLLLKLPKVIPDWSTFTPPLHATQLVPARVHTTHTCMAPLDRHTSQGATRIAFHATLTCIETTFASCPIHALAKVSLGPSIHACHRVWGRRATTPMRCLLPPVHA